MRGLVLMRFLRTIGKSSGDSAKDLQNMSLQTMQVPSWRTGHWMRLRQALSDTCCMLAWRLSFNSIQFPIFISSSQFNAASATLDCFSTSMLLDARGSTMGDTLYKLRTLP